MPRCDHVFAYRPRDYIYCENEATYVLEGVHYCGLHEPFPVGDRLVG